MSQLMPISAASEAGEEPFSIDEIFFSRTDKRGVIQSGNSVFCRVSGYDWDKLIGAPHRIVRHPDMPKAVFWLLWQTILNDRPMVAYVKNRSASGRWYWVVAVVVPLVDGFLSLRIKPSTSMLEKVSGIYAEVRAAEAAMTPEQSAKILLARLADLGFATYDDFATLVLQTESASRDAILGLQGDGGSDILSDMSADLVAMREQQSVLMEEFDALQSIPTNMRIIASRLEPSGGPVSAISDNYKFSSADILRQLQDFAGSDNNLCQAATRSLGKAIRQSTVARLMDQLQRKFAVEVGSGMHLNVVEEQVRVAQLTQECLAHARTAIQDAERLSSALAMSSGEIRRQMLGLDTIRVMGRVESGRLGLGGAGLSAAIDQLDQRHARLAKVLQSLMDLSSALKTGISAYGRQFAA